jgi:hypothetical protein
MRVLRPQLFESPTTPSNAKAGNAKAANAKAAPEGAM